MASLYLVRHGQASFGAADYDRLSPLGVEQAQRLGRWLAAGGARRGACVSGTPARQRDTARLCLQAWCGDADAPAPRVVAGFDEFDHREVLLRAEPAGSVSGHTPIAPTDSPAARRAFQHRFAAAVARWVGGAHDAEYTLSWAAFTARSASAASAALRDADGADVWAFTSAGTIAALLRHVLQVPDAQALELLWAVLNTSVTQLGWRDGRLRLLQFNSVAHLGGARELLSHR